MIYDNEINFSMIFFFFFFFFLSQIIYLSLSHVQLYVVSSQIGSLNNFFMLARTRTSTNVVPPEILSVNSTKR